MRVGVYPEPNRKIEDGETRLLSILQEQTMRQQLKRLLAYLNQ